MANARQKQIIIFISLISCLFFTAIALDITPLLRGPAPYPPDWRWDYLFVNTLSKIWVPVLCIGGIIWWFLQADTLVKKKKEYILLSGLVVLSFLFQLAVVYFSRAGILVLIHRIINPDLNGYFTAATMISNIPDFLRNYNAIVLQLPQHAQGHPPGAVFFFWYINNFFAFFSQIFSFLDTIQPQREDVRLVWNLLSLPEKAGALFSAFFIPFLSSFTIVPLYFLAKRVFGAVIATKTIFLYVFIPSVVLFIPINDVFLPLVTVLVVLFFVKAIQEKNNIWFFLTGIILALGVFFSLSLLPVGFFLGVYTLFLLIEKKITFRFFFWLSVYCLFGFIILPFILFIVFQFNLWEVGKTLMSGLPEKRVYFVWIWYNLYDFFIFGGIPVFLLFLLSMQIILKQIWKKQYKHLNNFLLAFIIMLVILNFSGSVRGEVARIWLPFYPLLILPLISITNPTKQVFLSILFLQATQILVMQEFWVTLW